MTTNISESLNSVFREARGLPICALAEFYRDKLQNWFCDRHASSLSTFTTLTTWAERILRERYELCRPLQVDSLAVPYFVRNILNIQKSILDL